MCEGSKRTKKSWFEGELDCLWMIDEDTLHSCWILQHDQSHIHVVVPCFCWWLVLYDSDPLLHRKSVKPWGWKWWAKNTAVWMTHSWSCCLVASVQIMEDMKKGQGAIEVNMVPEMIWVWYRTKLRQQNENARVLIKTSTDLLHVGDSWIGVMTVWWVGNMWIPGGTKNRRFWGFYQFGVRFHAKYLENWLVDFSLDFF